MDFGRSVPRPVTIAPLQLDDSGATADAEGGASPRTPSPSPRASPTTSGASPSAFGSASEGGEDEDDLMAHALGRGVRVARPLSVAPDPNVGIEMALAVETSDSSQSLAKEAEERAQEIEEVQSRRRSESMEERDARREADDWALDFAIACADGALFPDPDAEDRALPSAPLRSAPLEFAQTGVLLWGSRCAWVAAIERRGGQEAGLRLQLGHLPHPIRREEPRPRQVRPSGRLPKERNPGILGVFRG